YLRSDVVRRLESPTFLLEIAAMLLAGSLLGLEALRAAVPGSRPSRLTMGGIITAGALARGLPFRPPPPLGGAARVFVPLGEFCLWRTAVLVVIPWTWLLVALRRGAPLASARAAALAGAAAFGVTFVVMRFCCRTDELLHLTVFHVLPVLVGTGLSA